MMSVIKTTNVTVLTSLLLLLLNSVKAEINPTLPFGDINVLVLTDTHSWIGGHGRQESPKYNADYGDVLSLYQHLKRHCDEMGNDLWFVMNGDWIDGTGLALDGDPSYLVPLLQKMPWDAVNCGNHELYKDDVVEYVQRPGGFVDWWGDKYLTSNVRLTSNGKPLGHKYKILKGKNANVLVFGFLYNLSDPSDEILVKRVQDEVKDKWFQHALKREEYDAVLVLAHMDHEDELVEMIRKAIRGIINKPKFPIQFITGHSHIRAISFPDDYSSSFEAGKYLDTVGFVSFPTYESVLENSYNVNRRELIDETIPEGTIAPTVNNDTLLLPPIIEEEEETPPPYPSEQQPHDPMPPVPQTPEATVPEGNPMFKHVFMDANIGVFQNVLGGISVPEFETDDGEALSTFIYDAQEKMGLHDEIGCADRDYVLNATIEDESSLWRLFQRHVGPYWFQEDPENHVLMVNKESWRYDLLSAEPLVLDDLFAVAPFNDTVIHMGEYDGSVISGLEDTLNLWGNLDAATAGFDSIPTYITVGNVTDENAKYHLYTFDWTLKNVRDGLKKVIPPDATLAPPTETTFSSTLMWVKFVSETFVCPGDEPQIHLPDWFPTQDTVTGNDDDTVRRAVAIVLALVVVIFLVVALICFLMFFRYLCCSGHSAVSQEELDAFTMDNDYDDDDDDGANEYDHDDDDVYDMGKDYDTEMTNGDHDDNELL